MLFTGSGNVNGFIAGSGIDDPGVRENDFTLTSLFLEITLGSRWQFRSFFFNCSHFNNDLQPVTCY